MVPYTGWIRVKDHFTIKEMENCKNDNNTLVNDTGLLSRLIAQDNILEEKLMELSDYLGQIIDKSIKWEKEDREKKQREEAVAAPAAPVARRDWPPPPKHIHVWDY